jgi:hypothetical protein
MDARKKGERSLGIESIRIRSDYPDVRGRAASG